MSCTLTAISKKGPTTTLTQLPSPQGRKDPMVSFQEGSKAHFPRPRQVFGSAQDVTLSLSLRHPHTHPDLTCQSPGSIQPSLRHPSESLESIGPAPLSRLPATPPPHPGIWALALISPVQPEEVGLMAGTQDSLGQDSPICKTVALQGILRA